ncbi:MAG: 30S ribosomal protein S2 [Bacteroidales bacterium]|nr:MAG: 30S ribosomal protein S2 [Bacteroidales bacterium]
MSRTNFKELLDAGVHFGHLKRKWNPNMAPYIFMERNGIHIIDLEKTTAKIDEAAAAMKQIVKSGRKILFVATKKQAKEIVAEKVKKINMPYVTERWPGGMLTNFPTIRKAVKKMSAIDKMATDGTFNNLSKREKLQITRQRAKLEKNLGSIADLTRLPAALFVVDVSKENIAVREARRLNIPVFGMVDTNSDPTRIDFPIPANDDASKSIALIVNILTTAIHEGLDERKMEKEKEAVSKDKKADKKEDAEEEATAMKDTSSKDQPVPKGTTEVKTKTPTEKQVYESVEEKDLKSNAKTETKTTPQEEDTKEQPEVKETKESVVKEKE